MRQEIINKKSAFTLAEVLVTLAIIGIVAALTIPGLMKNYQDSLYKTQLKAAYSILSRATKSVMSDNNDTMLNLCGPTGANAAGVCLSATSHNYVTGLYRQYLSSIKSCSTWDAETGQCWYTDPVKNYSPNCSWGENTMGYARIVLNNGMLLSITYSDGSCSSSGIGCGGVVVDVNGKKAPNRYGYDVFTFTITSNGIIPEGNNGIYGGWCNPTAVNGTGTGYGCTTERLLEQ